MSFIINPYSFATGGGASYLLDTYTGASVAYSLRQLKTGVTNCIRVRRSSDDAEQDIGFSSGVLDVSSLETFCSGTDGFVAIWYDQSGNANDAFRATATQQPKIVTSGTTEVSAYNGNYAIKGDGTDDFLQLTSSINTTQLFYQSLVFDRATTGIVSTGIGDNGSNKPNAFLWFSSGNQQYQWAGQNLCTHSSSNTSTGDFIVTTLRNASDDNKIWLNGVAGTTVSNVVGSVLTYDNIMKYGGTEHDGYFQELIYWASDQESNQGSIESEINGYYSIF